jgi:hypothetical protein
MSQTLKKQLDDGGGQNQTILNTDIKTVVSDLNKARRHVGEMLASRRLNISPPFARNLIMKQTRSGSMPKAQKYKIVGGKIYEAVQLTEHQFTGHSKLEIPDEKNTSIEKQQELSKGS